MSDAHRLSDGRRVALGVAPSPCGTRLYVHLLLTSNDTRLARSRQSDPYLARFSGIWSLGEGSTRRRIYSPESVEVIFRVIVIIRVGRRRGLRWGLKVVKVGR